MPIGPQSGAAIGIWVRGLLVLVALGMIAGFGLARSLTPDPKGLGTHQQLGFPPCFFRVAFGVTCPSCGGTTSFAHYVRGEWAESIQANTACFFLAISCTFLIPWSLASAWFGRTLGMQRPELWLIGWMSLIMGLAVINWIIHMLRSNSLTL